MTTCPVPQGPVITPARLDLGSPLSPADLSKIERHLHLGLAKWDTQVGDISILSEQPVILTALQWETLSGYAEKLASETALLELLALEKPELLNRIGVPQKLFGKLRSKKRGASPESIQPRAMRFDFHLTASGWCVSEVNSDVPGGWREATSLPVLYQPFYQHLRCSPSPLKSWGEAMQSAAQGGRVALLHAPGYLEDEQVVRTFRQELESRRIPCSSVQNPAALSWHSHRACSLTRTGERVAAIVRFYQAEWLASLPRNTGWMELFEDMDTPVLNPLHSVISESKRFPLAFEAAGTLCPTWQSLMPECRDPRDLSESRWDEWVLKGAYSNTGDQVHICGQLTARRLRHLLREARRHPSQWIAQRRFETLPINSCRGLVFPCIGVFVVNGRAAGAYARLSRGQVTHGCAVEAPVLIQHAD